MHWGNTPLGELTKPRVDRVAPQDHPDLPYLGLEHVESSTSRVLGVVPAHTVKSTALRFVAGDVLYARLRPYLNKVVRPSFGGLCSSEFIVLPETPRIDGGYLQHALTSAACVAFAMQRVTGDRPRISFDALAAFQIPLPPTTEEQRRIVAELRQKLARLDAGRDALGTTGARLRTYRASVLDAAWRGALAESTDTRRAVAVPQTLAREPRSRKRQRNFTTGSAPASVDASHRLPHGWKWLTLQELSWDAGYGTSEKCSYGLSGVPVLRIPNVVAGTIDTSDVKFASPSLQVQSDDALQPGDLLIVRTNGSVNLVGRAACVESRFERTHYFASYLIRYRIRGPMDMARWVSALLHAPAARRWMAQHAATSAGQHNISLTKLGRFALPIPPLDALPLAYETLERHLSIADRLQNSLERATSREQTLRHALLDAAMAGVR